MKYFLDTEFIEDGRTIDLISIGIVADDGREYYAVSDQFSPWKASDWVLENVLAPIGIDKKGWIATPDLLSPSQREHYRKQRSRRQIKEDLLIFLAGGVVGGDADQKLNWDEAVKDIEFWGYYADYDWVAFCQIWGTMMDLPKGLPMYCNDLKQWCDRLGNPQLPPQSETEHHALHDARWNKEVWKFLNTLSKI